MAKKFKTHTTAALDEHPLIEPLTAVLASADSIDALLGPVCSAPGEWRRALPRAAVPA